MSGDMFLQAMRRTASGVALVSASTPAGPMGLTVSSFVSASADPPSVLVCVRRRSPIVAEILTAKRFSVSLLAAHQAHVADVFAGRPRSGAAFDFACAEWLELDPAYPPVLAGAVAMFSCTLSASFEIGTHETLVGRVDHLAAGSGAPLIFADQRYVTGTSKIPEQIQA